MRAGLSISCFFLPIRPLLNLALFASLHPWSLWADMDYQNSNLPHALKKKKKTTTMHSSCKQTRETWELKTNRLTSASSVGILKKKVKKMVQSLNSTSPVEVILKVTNCSGCNRSVDQTKSLFPTCWVFLIEVSSSLLSGGKTVATNNILKGGILCEMTFFFPKLNFSTFILQEEMLA